MAFEPGRAKTGGRKKGTPNKSTAVLRDQMLKAFDRVGGEDYLVSVALDDPKTFCTLLGKLLPSEIKAAESDLQKSVNIMVNTGMTNRPPVGIKKAKKHIHSEES